MSQQRYKPELDGIRGLAILGVLLTHCYSYLEDTPLTRPILTVMSFGGWGVDLFFALSGFLITGILLETRQATNYLSSFYLRRFLRIFPLYYLVLGTLFAWALVSPWAAANMPVRQEWPNYVVYLQNVPWLWPHGFANGHMMSHFWSLAVEEQFYLVWPFVVLLLPETALLWICGVVFALALPLRLYLVSHVFGTSWASMIVTTSRMDGLFVGAACVLLLRKYRDFPWKLIILSGVTGAGLLTWVAVFHHRAPGQPIGSGFHIRTFGVTAIALLVGALLGLSQKHLPALERIFTTRWLRFFGRYSYGIYVFHVPIYDVASRLVAPRLGLQFPLALGPACLFILVINAISVAVAVVSFEFLESRILQLKGRFAPRFDVAKSPEVHVALAMAPEFPG
jgi:peptidoglycan/LPS O-acetylase OafA/YrhL